MSQKHATTLIIRGAYNLYLSCKVGDQDKNWAPHIYCNACATNLCSWMNRKRQMMHFAMLMVCRELIYLITDCYFCMVPPVQHGISKKMWTLSCQNIPTAMCPLHHGESLPILEPPDSFSPVLEDEQDEICET